MFEGVPVNLLPEMSFRQQCKSLLACNYSVIELERSYFTALFIYRVSHAYIYFS